MLRDNYLQTLALSLAERRGMEDFGFQQRLMQTLESAGARPRRRVSARRRAARRAAAPRGAVTRPELAVLLAYAKLALDEDLLESTVQTIPIWPASSAAISRKQSPSAFPMRIEHHRLRREIIATQLGNSMINRGGPTLIVRIADETGAQPAAIAAAFAAVRDSFDDRAQYRDRRLDNAIRGAAARALCGGPEPVARPHRLVPAQCRSSKGLADVVSHYRDGIAALGAAMSRWRAVAGRRRHARRTPQNEVTCRRRARRALAGRIADLGPLLAAPDIALIADRTGKPIRDVAATYFAAGAYFHLEPHRQRHRRHSGGRLFRPPRARPRA